MQIKQSFGRKNFIIINNIFLVILAILCVLPFWHVLSVSLSSSSAAAAGEVYLWPVGFTTKPYEFVLQKAEFIVAFGISVKRVILGSAINMLLTVLTAYPLSKEVSRFRARTVYAWIFAFTMFFGGGLIPTYMVVNKTGLIDSIWSLIIPGAVQVWNVILLLNFFRSVPKELEEAVSIDGASQWQTLWKIYIPISMPALATILLFTAVGHWNSWFDGLIYMNKTLNYPLQSYLQTLVVKMDTTKFLRAEDIERIKNISERTVKSAQIFLGALPILIVYPLLQRYFVKGIVIGSVKG